MGSLDTGSLSTESLEDLNLGKISELLKLGITAVSFITALNCFRPASSSSEGFRSTTETPKGRTPAESGPSAVYEL